MDLLVVAATQGHTKVGLAVPFIKAGDCIPAPPTLSQGAPGLQLRSPLRQGFEQLQLWQQQALRTVALHHVARLQ